MSEQESGIPERRQEVAPERDAYVAGGNVVFQVPPSAEPVPTPGSLGQKLREIREGLGRTREELAADSGVSVTTISELELGITKRPRRDTVRKLADALGLADDARADFEARRGAPSGGRNRPVPDVLDPAASGLPVVQGMATRTLPHPIRSFTGREEELAGLVRGLSNASGAGIHVIRGMPGVGKTSLAVQAAHQVAGGFPDGQFFVDLQGHTQGLNPLKPEEALRSVLHNCLGMPNAVIPRSVNDRAAAYRSLLAGTRTLILLDSAASSAQVRPLLPGDSSCAVIVTSRENLRGLDDREPLSLGTLPEVEGIALLRAIAGIERFAPQDPDLGTIAELCGYLPLAIRIIAAWMRDHRFHSARDVADMLADEHERLAHLQAEDVSVRAAFEVSYKRLPAAEQRLFRRLGLVPGLDFDTHAAASLADGDALRLLDSLLDHNLLVQQARDRYRLHDLVRVYARSLAMREDSAVFGRLLDFYLYAAQAADGCLERRSPRADDIRPVRAPVSALQLGTAAQAHDWAKSELANLDAAARYAAGTGRPDFTIALSMALAQYLRLYGPWQQGLDLVRLAGALALEGGDSARQAAALVYAGTLHRQLGQSLSAKVALGQAVRIYRRLGDRRGLAAALVESGVVKRLTDMTEEDGRDLFESLELYRELGDRHGEAGTLAEVGAFQRQTGDFEPALESLHRALALFRELGIRYGEAITLGYLGTVQVTVGAIEDARESLEGALAIYRERDESTGQANMLLFLGSVYKDLGQLEKALSSLDEARNLYAATGYRRGVAGALAYLGAAQQLSGNPEAAERSVSQAIEIFREVDDPGGETEALRHYAVLAMARRAPDEALARYEQALGLARRIRSRKDQADVVEGIAQVHLFTGGVPQARAAYEQALGLYESMNLDQDANRVRQALSGLRGGS